MSFKLEQHHYNNPWVKELRRTWRTDIVASLIEKRLSDPEHVGPYCWAGGKEFPSDIIVAFAEDSRDFMDKIIPAVGLLLYEVLHEKNKWKNGALKHLFSVIKDANITASSELVHEWLKKNYNLLVSKKEEETDLYRIALCCFARIQPKNKILDLFWSNIWLEASSYWWGAAFLGMRMQNPELACVHLPLFVERKLTTSPYILSGMWGDLKCRHIFTDALRKGLRSSSGWAGLTINATYGALSTELDKKMLLASLNDVSKKGIADFMIYHSIASTIKSRKIEDLVDMPKVVLVNKFDEESAKIFREDFAKAINTGQKIIPVVIDSYGGHVYSLMSMIATIQASPVDVATISTGKSMSCGGILLTCGKEGSRFIDPLATVMLHDVGAGHFGKVEEIKASTAEADRLNQVVFKLMAKNCGKDDEYFLKLLDEHKHADVFLSADDCKTHNIANHIRVPSFKIKVNSETTFS